MHMDYELQLYTFFTTKTTNTNIKDIWNKQKLNVATERKESPERQSGIKYKTQ